jgi:eukaryotic translation initiation factor 2C
MMATSSGGAATSGGGGGGGMFGPDRSMLASAGSSIGMFGGGGISARELTQQQQAQPPQQLPTGQIQQPIGQLGGQQASQTRPADVVAPAAAGTGAQLAQFQCPRRPNQGMEGRAILLRANHFKVSIPGGQIHYYNIDVQPDKCPRKVNRFILLFDCNCRSSFYPGLSIITHSLER